jgi:cell division protein FtsQ
MGIFQKYNFKKILIATVWVAIGVSAVVLLVAAVHKKDSRTCNGIEIEIRGVSNNFFIDQSDITRIVEKFAGGNIKGKAIEDFDLVSMENALKKEIWINSAELYFDNNDILQAEVHEREPIARLFSLGGNSFYIDSTVKILPLSEKLSARVPVFTGFPTDNRVLSKQDSSLLKDVKAMSMYIQKDSFLMAMIDQVDITGQRNFELIPKIGDQVIVFGDAKDMEQKFQKLRLFYKKVIPRYGWSRYNVINLQYKGQLVAKIRGMEDVVADSLRTMEMMKAIAAYTAKMAADSTQTIQQDNDKNSTSESLILQSFQRDDANEAMDDTPAPVVTDKPVVVAPPVVPKANAVAAPVKKPAAGLKKPAQQTSKPAVKSNKPAAKPAQQKPAKPAPAKPRAVMPPKNEY